MDAETHSKSPVTVRQAASALADAKAAHEAERLRPYDKWARYDARVAEQQARRDYEKAKADAAADEAWCRANLGVHAMTDGVIKTRRTVMVRGVKIPVVRKVTPHVQDKR